MSSDFSSTQCGEGRHTDAVEDIVNDPVDAEIVGFVVVDGAGAREEGHGSNSRELLSREEREEE